MVIVSTDLTAKRGGGGGGFFGRSSGSSGSFGSSSTSSWSSSTTPSFIYIGSGAGGGSVLVFIIIMVIAFGILKSAIKKKQKSSLVNIQLGFYLRKGELVEKVKAILKGMNPDDMNSCYIALREIGVLMLRNTDQIRWYNFDIKTFSSDSALESEFNRLTNEERTKYDEEELVNIKGVKRESQENKENLEEVFVISIVAGLFTTFKNREKTIEETLKLLQETSSIALDNFGGVSIWYNIMDKDDLITTYPEIRVI